MMPPRRRRMLRKRPEPLRRDRPLMIECYGVKQDHVRVNIGAEVYEFRPDGRGRLIAPVLREDHIECFLARADMYRKAS